MYSNLAQGEHIVITTTGRKPSTYAYYLRVVFLIASRDISYYDDDYSVMIKFCVKVKNMLKMLNCVIFLQLSQYAFSTDCNLVDYKEKNIMYMFYQESKSWEETKKKYIECKQDINAPMRKKYSTSLIEQIYYGNIFLVREMLKDKDINASDKSKYHGTALHVLAEIAALRKETTIHSYIAVKLIKRGCPINATRPHNETCLKTYYQQRNASDYRRLFDYSFATTLIENGASLMVKRDDAIFGILDSFHFVIKDHGEYLCDYEYPIAIIVDAFCKSFKKDFNEYCKTFLLFGLLLKYFKKNHKIIMPNALSQYIVSLCCDPIAHIEETISDGWDRLSLSKYLDRPSGRYKDKEIKIEMDRLKPIFQPNEWKYSWNLYQRGDRQPTNLIVCALNYCKNANMTIKPKSRRSI